MAEPTENPPPASSSFRSRIPVVGVLALLLACAALALSAWTWVEGRNTSRGLQQETARRLAQMEAMNREARLVAGESRESVRDVEARIGQLEARVVETQNQRLALESLYREMSGSRDEWVLAEVEQVLLIANQQLQLAGNVKGALIALETADMRLARLDRPQLTPLRRVIARDIERLKTAPYVDVTGMALRLDQVAGAVDALALSMDARPSQAVPATTVAPAGFWARLWSETVQDFRDLVRVQNTMKPEIPLVAPAQAYFLRENLKIRLLSARLALLARDEAGFRADLKAASEWLGRYYDGEDKSVATARAALEQLARAEISIDVPDISTSLEAARNLRLVRERSPR
jgi:uroporphyrin-3 C-methyltransferase